MALSGVGALAIAVGVLWASGGQSTALRPSATPTQRPPGTSTPGATATPEDPLGAVPLIIGDPVPFPENTSILVAQVPYNRSWGVLAVERWTRGTGVVVRETLFDSGANHISGVVTDGESIYLGLLTGECPFCLPGDDPARSTTILRSDDGGVTWAMGEPIQNVWIPLAADDHGLVIVGPRDVGYAYWLDGTVEPIEPPPSADPDLGVISLDGSIVWHREGSAALIDQSGTYFKPDFYDPVAFRIGDIVVTEDWTVLTWSNAATTDGDSARYIVSGTMAGGRTFLPQRAFVADRNARLVGALGPRVLASLEWVDPPSSRERLQGISPALLDLDTATIAPIAEFRDRAVGAVPILAAEGPFLRVNAPGDCLNIRATAGMDAAVVACAAHGVLLVDRADSWERDGLTWLAVQTPSGEAGWASAQFLLP